MVHAGSRFDTVDLETAAIYAAEDADVTLQLEGDLQGCLRITSGHCSLSNP